MGGGSCWAFTIGSRRSMRFRMFSAYPRSSSQGRSFHTPVCFVFSTIRPRGVSSGMPLVDVPLVENRLEHVVVLSLLLPAGESPDQVAITGVPDLAGAPRARRPDLDPAAQIVAVEFLEARGRQDVLGVLELGVHSQ